MKIITTDREIIYSNACGCSAANGEMTSNFTAEEKRAMFQRWYNVNKLDRNVVLEKGVIGAGGLRNEGAKDEKTTAAYKKFGEEFEKTLENRSIAATKSNPPPRIKNPFPKLNVKKPILDTITGIFNKDDTNPSVSFTKTPEQQKADKKKKMMKIALLAGGAIALTVIIIAIAKRKK
jgi:hypothetical protein